MILRFDKIPNSQGFTFRMGLIVFCSHRLGAGYIGSSSSNICETNEGTFWLNVDKFAMQTFELVFPTKKCAIYFVGNRTKEEFKVCDNNVLKTQQKVYQ
jgi:hypothetical protein